MPISHGHRPFDYNEFVPEMGAKDLITAVELKQNLYDQGIAQIQAQIDAYSTLPLIKDPDKQYMNQELDKYYQVIKSNVGSTDFSNPNSVRSFLDIARPMENDPIIKNAIESTHEYMNRRKTLEDIRTNKPHLYNEVNEWEYMKDTIDWMNDKNPGAKLGHKYYTPYSDSHIKKAAEIGEKSKPEIQSQLLRMKGLIGEEEITFLSEKMLKDRILAGMTPQELHQMDIEAQYHATLIGRDEKYDQVYNFYQNKYDEHTTAANIKGIENTGTTAQEHLAEAEAIKGVMDDLVDKKTNYINEPYLDRLYSNMYLGNWAKGMGRAYAYKQRKVKWETDQFSLESFKIKNQIAGYKEKFDYAQAGKLQFMKDTGQIIQNTQGQWVPNPNYKPKTTKADEPILFQDLITTNKGFDKLPITPQGFAPNSTIELKKDDLSPTMKTALENLMAAQGQKDPGDYNKVTLRTDARGKVFVDVTNLEWGNEDFTFSQDQLEPFIMGREVDQPQTAEERAAIEAINKANSSNNTSTSTPVFEIPMGTQEIDIDDLN